MTTLFCIALLSLLAVVAADLIDMIVLGLKR